MCLLALHCIALSQVIVRLPMVLTYRCALCTSVPLCLCACVPVCMRLEPPQHVASLRGSPRPTPSRCSPLARPPCRSTDKRTQWLEFMREGLGLDPLTVTKARGCLHALLVFRLVKGCWACMKLQPCCDE